MESGNEGCDVIVKPDVRRMFWRMKSKAGVFHSTGRRCRNRRDSCLEVRSKVGMGTVVRGMYQLCIDKCVTS